MAPEVVAGQLVREDLAEGRPEVAQLVRALQRDLEVEVAPDALGEIVELAQLHGDVGRGVRHRLLGQQQPGHVRVGRHAPHHQREVRRARAEMRDDEPDGGRTGRPRLDRGAGDHCHLVDDARCRRSMGRPRAPPLRGRWRGAVARLVASGGVSVSSMSCLGGRSSLAPGSGDGLGEGERSGGRWPLADDPGTRRVMVRPGELVGLAPRLDLHGPQEVGRVRRGGTPGSQPVRLAYRSHRSLGTSWRLPFLGRRIDHDDVPQLTEGRPAPPGGPQGRPGRAAPRRREEEGLAVPGRTTAAPAREGHGGRAPWPARGRRPSPAVAAVGDTGGSVSGPVEHRASSSALLSAPAPVIATRASP